MNRLIVCKLRKCFMLSALVSGALSYGDPTDVAKVFNNRFKESYKNPLLTDEGKIRNKTTASKKPGAKHSIIEEFHQETDQFWQQNVDMTDSENPQFNCSQDEILKKVEAFLGEQRAKGGYKEFKNATAKTQEANQKRFLALAGARLVRLADKGESIFSTIPYLSGKERLLREPDLLDAHAAQSLLYGGNFSRQGKVNTLVGTLREPLAAIDNDFKELRKFQQEDESVISHYKDKQLTQEAAENVAFGQVIGSIAGPRPYKGQLKVRDQLASQRGNARNAGVTNPDEAERLLEDARNKFCGSMEDLTVEEAFNHHYTP